MLYQITRKQHNSKLCFVCGLKNNFGLKASFFETESQELIALFTPEEKHQSYPGRLHGGIASTILDEAIGRAIMIGQPKEVWGVTAEFTIRYKKPVPLGVQLKVLARVTKQNSRLFEGTGEIILPDGDIAATAHGKYFKMPLENIADFDPTENEWQVIHQESDPKTLEI